MHRRYNRWWSRFDQPDPSDGSYDLSDPQSFNRYSYVQNDPVNFIDPSGLDIIDGTYVPPYSESVTTVGNFGRVRGGGGGGGGRLSEIAAEESVDSGGGGGDGGGGDGGSGTPPQTSTAPGQRLSNEDCATRLAALFGGRGARASLGLEPSTLQHPIAGRNRGDDGHSATPRNDRVGTEDRGGIIHIYGNDQGTATDTGLYVPAGFSRITSVRGEDGRAVQLTAGTNNRRFYANDAGIVIAFVHVATSGVRLGPRNAAGSTHIGNIGGPGGRAPGYTHTHIAFYSQYYGNPTTGTRIDPRSIFCR